jgi:hypothetical protein
VKRTIEYDVTLLPDGTGRATASVTLDNDSPSDPSTRALASLLLPHAGPADLEPGEAYERTTITGGRGSRLMESSVNGADSPMTAPLSADFKRSRGSSGYLRREAPR